MKDMEYMKLALELAENGCGYVNPNPMVGAVIVKNGEIIGSGYHENYGELHAERKAINSCVAPLDGATMYVTLEPCCHYGKTPPCTEAIIESGIKRVIVGSLDPNPLVAGKGIEALRNNNIEVETGLMDMDNPKLTCRIPMGRNGTRIVCDTNLRIPFDSKIIQTASEIPTFIATSSLEMDKIKKFSDMGCKVIQVPKKDGHIDLNVLMIKLGEEKIDSILLEGGSTLNFSGMKSGIVNKVEADISPKMFGGSGAKSPVGGIGIENPDNAFKLVRKNMKMFGEDIFLEYEVMNNVYGNS